MMSKKSPQLRFKGFTDDWEDRKLGDVLSERNDQTPETNEYPLMSFVQGKGVTPKGERYNRSFLVKDSEKKYKKTELGDFIYSSNNLETGSIGFNRTGKAVISPVYSIFESKKSRESQFIGIMSVRKDFISKMVRFRQGVVYGQWRIHESDFLNIDMKMPNDKEQQLIISFFENIDKTIALHQHKLDLLKEQKKGYLQKMFPKNGEKVPELRFAGFTDTWEERKLGDVTESFDGKRIPIDSGLRVSGEYPYYGATGIIDYVDDYIFDGEYVLLAEDGANIIMRNYPVAYLTQGKFWLNNHAHIMRMKDGSNYFLVQMLEKIDYMKYNTGTAQPKLNSKIVKNIEFKLPHIEEQQKIGTFFKQLDDTIALHQRKLDLLKEQKKGLLQKMFV